MMTIKEIDNNWNNTECNLQELVRCKDCKRGEPGDCGYGVDCDGVWHHDNWFCADNDMIPTGEEIQEAFKKCMLWFGKNKHMLAKDRERDAIDTIKAKGNHIGTCEARTILEVIRVFFNDYNGQVSVH